MTTPQPKNRFAHWLKTSITARMIMVGFLILVLLIPLSYITDLIYERQLRKNDIMVETYDRWGNPVLLYGPVLKVPFKAFTETITYNETTKTNSKEFKTSISYAYFFPSNLGVKADVKIDSLSRGIYKAPVYHSDIELNGSFQFPDVNSHNIKEENMLWEEATVILQTTNLKGIRSEMEIHFGNGKYKLHSNYSNEKGRKRQLLQEMESNQIQLDPLTSGTDISFDMKLAFNGSEYLKIIPVGNKTTMQMTSNWPHPNFFGNFLPDDQTKTITENGFEANWQVLEINRPFSQTHVNKIPDLEEFSFGTKFMMMVDDYQKSERSVKYGFLVIALTFLVFFLIQTLSKIDIHPFQYLMIGLALTMFYTLLISITEHSSFLLGYIIAGIAVIAIISWYSKSILKSNKLSLFIALALSVLYGFIFVIIQLENYALIVGSIGLFLILAAVMYFSRKIDWNKG